MLKSNFAVVLAGVIALLALALIGPDRAMAQDGAATGASEASETAAEAPDNAAGKRE